MYKVQYLSFGEWLTDSNANGVNLLYAECIAKYHKERGRKTRIVDFENIL